MAHPIRLARPWNLEHSADSQLVASRRFNRPTGLAGDQSVVLSIHCHPGTILQAIELNDQPLAGPPDSSPATWRVDILPRLADRNLLRLTLATQHRPDPAALAAPNRFDLAPWAEVVLEIRGGRC